MRDRAEEIADLVAANAMDVHEQQDVRPRITAPKFRPTRVRFWSADRSGCGFYRCTVPAMALQQRGHETWVNPIWKDEDQRPDVLVAQRTSRSGPTQRFLNFQGFKIYELDDALLDLDASNPGNLYYSQPEVRDNIRRCLGSADRIVVSTAELANRIADEITGHPEIYVVRNHIPERFIGDGARRDPFAVGWSGSATHDKDWDVCHSYVARAVRGAGRHLVVYGDPPEKARKIATHVGEWENNVHRSVARLLLTVGLAPLRPSIFNRCKSHIKALEYNARGIPVLASAVGEYPDYVEHGFNGVLVKGEPQWRSYIDQLAKDRALWEFMSMNATDKAREWTVEANAEEIERAYLP